MSVAASKFQLSFSTLPVGFHHHRFEADGVGFNAWIWRGTPGPVLLLNGGTHGDEYEGPTLLRQWIDNWRPSQLRGTVIMIPVLNEGAFFAGARCHPFDSGNLARAFPGTRDGTETSRLAHLFETEVLMQATHYVDLHSGGNAYELHPWVGYMTGGGRVEREQRTLAACFDRFWCWAGPFLPGRTLSAAHKRRIAAIYIECRGAGGVRPADLSGLDRGLHNLLRQLNCLDGPVGPLDKQRFRSSRDAEEAHLQVHHPSPLDGLFACNILLGESVRQGQPLGLVWPLSPKPPVVIRAERDGTVVACRRQRSVRKGDALFTLAPI